MARCASATSMMPPFSQPQARTRRLRRAHQLLTATPATSPSLPTRPLPLPTTVFLPSPCSLLEATFPSANASSLAPWPHLAPPNLTLRHIHLRVPLPADPSLLLRPSGDGVTPTTRHRLCHPFLPRPLLPTADYHARPKLWDQHSTRVFRGLLNAYFPGLCEVCLPECRLLSRIQRR